jgi:hypothetical protein
MSQDIGDSRTLNWVRLLSFSGGSFGGSGGLVVAGGVDSSDSYEARERALGNGVPQRPADRAPSRLSHRR